MKPVTDAGSVSRKDDGARAEAASKLAPYGSGQLDLAAGGIGLMAIEKHGVADGADADAAAFSNDFFRERGAFIAFDADEAELDELVVVELLLEFVEELGREASFADFDYGIERLTESAEESLLGASEREIVHEGGE